MKVFEMLGLLLVYAMILLIDKPKLNAVENKRKYCAAYYTIVAVGFILGILGIFRLVPTLNETLENLFPNLAGS